MLPLKKLEDLNQKLRQGPPPSPLSNRTSPPSLYTWSFEILISWAAILESTAVPYVHDSTAVHNTRDTGSRTRIFLVKLELEKLILLNGNFEFVNNEVYTYVYFRACLNKSCIFYFYFCSCPVNFSFLNKHPTPFFPKIAHFVRKEYIKFKWKWMNFGKEKQNNFPPLFSKCLLY